VDPAEWPVGQAVAFFGYGVSFREMTVLPVASLLKVPTATPEWTTLPVSALTASGGLEVVGKIQNFAPPNAPASVLVTGAAGGTGHIAVQWAKAMYGARVAGTCGTAAKADMLTSLGVDVVVNYRTSRDVEEELRAAFPSGFDIVYDGVGGRIGDVARRLLSPTGVFVGIGSVSQDYSGTKGPDTDNAIGAGAGTTGLKEGQSETFFFMPAGPQMVGQAAWDDIVARTIDAMATGKVRAVLDEECGEYVGVDGVYKAQERMRKGLNVGKIYASFPEKAGATGQCEAKAGVAVEAKE
jgi:NADPH:quinone reductase-like Zn-dependent oxidoreductase